jgi:hypothetical protein
MFSSFGRFGLLGLMQGFDTQSMMQTDSLFG